MVQDEKQAALQKYCKEKRVQKIKYILLCMSGVLGFFILWQLVVELEIIETKSLPSVTDVIETLIYKIGNSKPDGNTLGINILASLQVAMLGYGLSLLIGIPLGLVMGWYKFADKFIKPIFEVIRPIPSIAWIPMIILWVGIGVKAKGVIIFLAAFIPCVINSHLGVKSTNPVLVNLCKTFGASNFYIFTHVAIPSAIPMVLTGARIALNSSWMTLVAAELLSANAGLGYMISMGRMLGRADIVLVGMVVIGILGVILNAILGMIEKRLLKWMMK